MIAKLVWKGPEGKLQEFPIDQECTLIGRAESNHVTIPNRAVSQHHARIISLLNDFFLEDLGSTNGTYVNHTPIQKRVLHHGDLINVGRESLHFYHKGIAPSLQERLASTNTPTRPTPQVPAPAAPTATEAVAAIAVAEAMTSTSSIPNPTLVVPPPDTPGAMTMTPAVSEEGKSVPSARLVVESGPLSGEIIALHRGVTTIGNPGEAVVAISKRGERFFAMFIDSGDAETIPSLNNTPLRSQGTLLNDSDVITMDRVRMRFLQAKD